VKQRKRRQELAAAAEMQKVKQRNELDHSQLENNGRHVIKSDGLNVFIAHRSDRTSGKNVCVMLSLSVTLVASVDEALDVVWIIEEQVNM